MVENASTTDGVMLPSVVLFSSSVHNRTLGVLLNARAQMNKSQNKNQLALEESREKTRRLEAIIDLIKHIASLAGGCWCVYIVISGLTPLASSGSPEALHALADIVKAFQLDQIIGYLVGGVASAAWYSERKGKKRAIKEKSALQKRLESDEPNRASSGLTNTGDTPTEEPT